MSNASDSSSVPPDREELVISAMRRLRHRPRDPNAMQALAIRFLASGRLEHGINLLERSSLRRPLDATHRIELAIAYGRTGRETLAIDLLMLEATESNLVTEEMLRVAVGLNAFGRPKLAMEACRRAGVASPESANVYLLMARLAYQSEYPRQTVEALFRRAIDLEPKTLNYRLALVTHLMRWGDDQSAAALMNSVSVAELRGIENVCHVERLAELFHRVSDAGMYRVCLERLKQLEQNDFHLLSPLLLGDT